MKKNKAFSKLGLVLFGIAAVFLFIELVMSIAGYFTGQIIPSYEHALNDNKKTIRVLCLGDSFTYGNGAEARYSYPAQMEKILNAKKQGGYEVINLGVQGSNSTQVLKKLKISCARLNPEAVVVLCGGNDIWNFDECNIRLNRMLFRSIAARSKTAKLFYVFSQNIKSKIARFKAAVKNDDFASLRLSQTQDAHELIRIANLYRSFGYYEWAKRFYYKARQNADNDFLAAFELARCYKLNKEYPKAIDVLEYLLTMQPDDEQAHFELKDVFIKMDATEETILFYKRFLLKFPENYFARKFLSQAYIRAAGDLYLDNYLKESREYYSMALALDPSNRNSLRDSLKMVEHSLKIKTDYMKSKRHKKSGFFKIADLYIADIVITERLVEEVLSENLNKMVDFCQSNNIKLFFSGYPELTSPVMEKVAFARGVELVRHQEKFVRLLKDKPYFYFFVSEEDSHCTKHGYRILAENIANAILEQFPD